MQHVPYLRKGLFRDHHIQVKDNEIVDSGSLKGDHIRYTGNRYLQVNLTVNIRDDFWKVFSDIIHRVTAIYRAVTYRFDCTLMTSSFRSRMNVIARFRIPRSYC